MEDLHYCGEVPPTEFMLDHLCYRGEQFEILGSDDEIFTEVRSFGEIFEHTRSPFLVGAHGN